MTDTAKLTLKDKSIDLPVVVGTENEHAVDIGSLRKDTGFITLDDGYGNTGACKSAITFIDGEAGILRYRGFPIEQLAQKSTFVESAWLLIHGELPTRDQLAGFNALLDKHAGLHEGVYKHFEAFPPTSHPMAILSAMINAVSCYHPDVLTTDLENFDDAAARLLSKVRTIAAAGYLASLRKPVNQPRPGLDYCAAFLDMMFSGTDNNHALDPDVVQAMDLIFLLHADHEQNCSTSTVRMVGSSGANLFASCSAGVCALWGPLHGGANAAVLDMLAYIHDNRIDLKDYVALVKDKSSHTKLMGFGHRVYKNYDPRAKIIKVMADKILAKLKVNDPLLDIARRLEETALSDSYFRDRKLYPNVDFYSGIIMRAMGIPVNMFTVIFSIGRMPGWMAHWKEMHDTGGRINRPRQVYTGKTQRDYVPLDKR